jgi:hypothetical protein
MAISEIQLYQLLKEKLGENETEQLVSFVKGEVKTEFTTKQHLLATKDDITNVKDEMNHLREDMLNIKADLSKSIYVVGLIQFLAITGSILAIINFTIK